MSKTTSLATSLAMLLMGANLCAQTPQNYDVFIPIAKYFARGDAESLSAWFDDDLEISVFTNASDASRNQARQIVKAFFESYNPRDFRIAHTASSNNMKYAIGTLSAGGENFGVTILLDCKEGSYYIQQIKIERRD